MERKESAKVKENKWERRWDYRGKNLKWRVSISSLCFRLTILYPFYFTHAKNGRYSCSWSFNQHYWGKVTSSFIWRINRKDQPWAQKHKKIEKRFEWSVPMSHDPSHQKKYWNWRNTVFIWNGKRLNLHSWVWYAKIGSLEKIICDSFNQKNKK